MSWIDIKTQPGLQPAVIAFGEVVRVPLYHPAGGGHQLIEHPRVGRRTIGRHLHRAWGVLDPDAPFGGFKQSGFGRERGRYGVTEFLATQTLHRSRDR